jgi:hypothetical protein
VTGERLSMREAEMLEMVARGQAAGVYLRAVLHQAEAAQ